MGVYLPNMEMPKCCAECDAEGHYENSYGDEYGFFCPFGYKAYTEETREAKRLDNYPLVPVPPHGRLIDADALKNLYHYNTHDSDIDKAWTGNIRRSIDSAPTIIPAEGASDAV